MQDCPLLLYILIKMVVLYYERLVLSVHCVCEEIFSFSFSFLIHICCMHKPSLIASPVFQKLMVTYQPMACAKASFQCYLAIIMFVIFSRWVSPRVRTNHAIFLVSFQSYHPKKLDVKISYHIYMLHNPFSPESVYVLVFHFCILVSVGWVNIILIFILALLMHACCPA